MGMILHYGEPGNRLSNFKLCIAVCSYDNVTAGFAHSLMSACVELQKKAIEFYTLLFFGNCHVDDSRNKLVRDFLKTDCTHLLFIDSDLMFPPESLLKIITHDYDVIGGVYPFKEPQERYVVDPLNDSMPDDSEVLEVKGLGTGFLMIKRCVLEKLASESIGHFDQKETDFQPCNKIPIIFERIVENDTRFGGDYAFCWKWRKSGGKIYADTTLELIHIGINEWQGIYQVYLRRQSADGIKKELDLIRAGQETNRDIIMLKKIYGNDEWAATEEMLFALIMLARVAKENILECGSGLSTLVMASANPNVTIYALEQDPSWAAYIQSQLDHYQLSNVKVLYSPLTNNNGRSWYTVLSDLPMFDMALCDGPRKTRAGFYGAMHDKISSGAPIVFDDYGTHVCEKDVKIWGDNMKIFGEIRKFAVVHKQ
jgi:predicted O-methyltransferase YrrM